MKTDKPIKGKSFKSLKLNIIKSPSFPILKELTHDEQDVAKNYANAIHNAGSQQEVEHLLWALGEKLKSNDKISGNYFTQNMDKIIKRLAKIKYYHDELLKVEQGLEEIPGDEKLARKQVRLANLLRGTFRFVRTEMKKLNFQIEHVKQDYEKTKKDLQSKLRQVSNEKDKQKLSITLEHTKQLIDSIVAIEQMLLVEDSRGGAIDSDIKKIKRSKTVEDTKHLRSDLKKGDNADTALIARINQFKPFSKIGKTMVIVAMMLAAAGPVAYAQSSQTQSINNTSISVSYSNISFDIRTAPAEAQQLIPSLSRHFQGEEGAIVLGDGFVYIAVQKTQGPRSRAQQQEINRIPSAVINGVNKNGMDVSGVEFPNGTTIGYIGADQHLSFYMMSENEFTQASFFQN